MIREAIQFLQSQSATALGLLDTTKTPLAALPDDMKIASLEQYMEFRSNFRGEFSTISIEEFVSYSNSDLCVAASCFINAIEMKAVSFFDIGDIESPGHCRHKAILTLEKTAEYKALLSIDGLQISQKKLAEWIEDWHEAITVLDPDGNDIETKRAIAAIRNITIEEKRSLESSQESFSSSKSAMEKIEAKSRDAEPAFIEFDCVPYSHLQKRKFLLRLSIITSGEPKLVARIIRHESAIEEMGNELQQTLDEGMDSSRITTFVGQFNSK
ncbi:MAG: DUF2303 family protein [Cellvibrionaceae bacterium]